MSIDTVIAPGRELRIDPASISKIHCIGIGGIGVSALAKFFRANGATVSGSNATPFEGREILEGLGITVSIGHAVEHVPHDADCIVYSSAVSEDNPERIFARECGIPSLEYPEMLGVLMKRRHGVAVSGTHGKTTSTALLGRMLESGGLDPTVVVGGIVTQWESNLRVGKGDIFLAEGCEYRRNMLKLHPKLIVLTNIEEDHLDYYKDLADIEDAFRVYVCNLNPESVVVFNADDKRAADLCLCNSPVLKISFGLQPPADLYAEDIRHAEGYQQFRLVWRKKDLGIFTTVLPGIVNIYNIMGAAAAALSLGVPPETLRATIANFRGVHRRFERMGTCGRAIVISDYAHHPTAVRKTIAAAKEFYPGKKILAVFQPHQRDRTIKLFDDFTASFEEADGVIFSEIYEVEGRNESVRPISSRDLLGAIRKQYPALRAVFAANLRETEELVKKMERDFDVVLLMGAGDIHAVARNLVGKE